MRNGHTKKEVKEMLELGINTLRSWEKLEEETGSLNNRPLDRKPYKIDRGALLKYCEENPFATHKEAAIHFNCNEAGIRHAKKALKITRKKTIGYIERDEKERAEFIETINKLPDDAQIFYADESGFEEYYSRVYGYAPSNKRVYGNVSGTRFERTNVVGAINENSDFIAGFAFKGKMNSDLFEGWLESVFVPTLENPEKSVLIIDNASYHSKDRIQDIVDEFGFTVIFLPKYSPDLNPIEKYWANIKNWLRYHLERFDSFWDALIHAFKGR